MPGHLIVFEGPDGVGKSTSVEYLRTLLTVNQVPSEFFSFPGKRPGTLGKLVYDLHHEPQTLGINSISPIGIQALHIAAHLDTITQTIIPAMNCQKCVVLDRFWWSTWVYGRAEGIPPEVLDSLIQAEKHMWGAFVPSVVFLLERPEPLVPGNELLQFSTLVALYRKLAISEREHHPVIHFIDKDIESLGRAIQIWAKENQIIDAK